MAKRILLDACIPKRLKQEFGEHEVWTAKEARLNSVDDGQLLDAMADRFDILVTMDKSIGFQQRLEGRPVAIVLLRAKSNRLPDLLPLVPKLAQALREARPGNVIDVSA
jgi:predicted nuclease of predicted toxin-antitoxin system